MQRHRWVLLSLVSVVVPVVVLLSWPSGNKPCRAKFERVQIGMAFEEVCALVGGTPGVYSGRLDFPIMTSGPPALAHKTWVAGDSTLYVCFDTEVNQAIAVAIYDPPPDDRSVYQVVRNRLGF